VNVRYFTNAEGEEMAVLPRADLEAMTELADHANAISDYRSGKLPGLKPEEARSFIEAPSPLAFWRRYRGFTQHSLSQATGITQNYLSELENAKRTGSVDVWLKLSKVLRLPVEALIEAE
jgi:DNA-binding XRE family transcriptional regulator